MLQIFSFIFLISSISQATSFTQTGIASLYDDPQPTACAKYPRFDPKEMTAAHKSLPCGSIVRVTNLSNKKNVEVRITDRGPYVAGRIIDLSSASFAKLAPISQGLIQVRVDLISTKTKTYELAESPPGKLSQQ